MLNAIIKFLDWITLAYICRLLPDDCQLLQLASLKVLHQALWLNSMDIRECLGYDGGKKISAAILRSLPYSSNLLTELYWDITRKKYREKNCLTNVHLSRRFNWIIDNIFLAFTHRFATWHCAQFNPTYDILLCVHRDWSSFTFQINAFGQESGRWLTGKQLYHYTAAAFDKQALLAKWSPNGKYLLTFEYADTSARAHLFEYFPKAGCFREVKCTFPKLDLTLQTSNSWMTDNSFVLVPKEAHLARDKLIYQYTINMSTIEKKEFKITLPSWHNVGVLTTVVHSNSIFLLELCEEEGHDYHHNLLEIQLVSGGCVYDVVTIYQINGYILDLRSDRDGKLFYFVRRNKRKHFTNGNEFPIVVHANSLKKCYFLNPTSKQIKELKNNRQWYYNIHLGCIDVDKAESLILNYCPDVFVKDHYTEEPEFNQRENEKFDPFKFFNQFIISPQITNLSNRHVLLKQYVFLIDIPFTYYGSGEFYIRHPTKPFFLINKAARAPTNSVDICLTPCAKPEFQIKFPKAKNIDYNRAKRIKLIE